LEEFGGRYVVLVPLNGSKKAERVLQHMQEFSQRCPSAVILLRVIGFSPVAGPEEWCVAPPVYRFLEIYERRKQAKLYLSGL
jgi:hypothetical protein